MLVLSESIPILTGVVVFLAALHLWLSRGSKVAISVPPGPKPIPILGNLNDIPGKEPWFLVTKLAKQYGKVSRTWQCQWESLNLVLTLHTSGDVVYMHFLGRGVVFLNSVEAVYDLLDKRGSIYSDRPTSIMAEL